MIIALVLLLSDSRTLGQQLRARQDDSKAIRFPEDDTLNNSGQVLLTFSKTGNYWIHLCHYDFILSDCHLDFSVESQSPFVPVLSGRQSKTLVEAPRSVFQQISLQHQQALASHREAVSQHRQLVRDSISGGDQNSTLADILEPPEITIELQTIHRFSQSWSRSLLGPPSVLKFTSAFTFKTLC